MATLAKAPLEQVCGWADKSVADKLVARAKELRPFLAEQAPEGEKRRSPTEAVDRMLKEEGFLQLIVPQRLGGGRARARGRLGQRPQLLLRGGAVEERRDLLPAQPAAPQPRLRRRAERRRDRRLAAAQPRQAGHLRGVGLGAGSAGRRRGLGELPYRLRPPCRPRRRGSNLSQRRSERRWVRCRKLYKAV